MNPFVLSGTIRGLLVRDLDSEPFLSVEEAYANFQLSSFFGRPWVFKEVSVTKPYCRVQINKDYSLNFSDLITKFAQPSSPPPPTPPKKSDPLILHVGGLHIEGASASFTDLTTKVPFHRLIGPVDLRFTELHTDPYNKNPYSFTGTTDSGERFAWSGQFTLEPLQSSGDLSLEGLNIRKYSGLFQEEVKFVLNDGVFSGQASYLFELADTNFIVNITNAACSLRSLKVGEPGGSNNLVELDRFAVSGASACTSNKTAEVNQISVEGGRLAAKRNPDQSINLLALAEPAPDSATRPGGGILFLMRAATNALSALLQSTNLWSATLHNLDVTNCGVRWDDLSLARPVQVSVDDIAVSGRHLSNVAGSNQTASLSLRWNTNGTMRVDTTLQISPLAVDVDLKLDHLELEPLDPYLQSFLNLFLSGSKVSTDGSLRVRIGTNGLPDATFAGEARLNDFATLDSQTQDLVKWESAQVTGINAGLQSMAVSATNITVVAPYARVALDTNRVLNFLSVLRTNSTSTAFGTNDAAGAAATASTSSNSPAQTKLGLGQRLGSIIRQALGPASTNDSGGTALPRISVESIVLTNGVVEFHDDSVQPPVSASVTELAGTIANVSTEQLKRADIHITGKAPGTGPIEINGQLNPLDQSAPTQITVSFRDVDLSPTSPYAGKFLGYRLERGRLGLQVEGEVNQRELKSKNVVVVDHLTLGEKVASPDATKLPVKLAVALLKDRNGKIEIELPVEGNLDDPKFRFGTAIGHVLGNLVTKLVTSPFSMLGAVFGGKGEEVSYQDFAPGSAELQAEHASNLDALINGLYDRPGLELQIEGSFDPARDTDGLRKQRLEREFRQQKWAGLRKADQANIKPEQVELSPDEMNAFMQVAYNAAVRAGVPTNAAQSTSADGASAKGQPNPPSTRTPDAKGAAALLQRTPAQSSTVDEIERVVLSTISISDNDFTKLAIDRARAVQQKILDSGKVEASRLSLTDVARSSSTNRACRVFFHLE
jgi:hypothetical protein